MRFTAILLLAASFTASAQTSKITKAKLSPRTQEYLYQQTQNGFDAPMPGYNYKIHNGITYVSNIVKVNSNVVLSEWNALGIQVGTKAGNIWTVQVPMGNMKAFTALSGLEYIQVDEPVAVLLDSARVRTHVDSVHAGINLPMAYTGKNVVVGVIDAGFDYTNPAYYDTSGTRYRIKKVWEQTATGTPPSGYLYGNEYADSNAVRTAGTDHINLSHGTHVSNIAAGSGFGSSTDNKTYRGMAYESDIALVAITPSVNDWVSTGEADMIDGAAYIYNYANSVGKPAVINLSWGTPIGPRDGSSLFSQAMDNITGAGKIFVCAAGNNGTDYVHVQKTFTPTDTVLSTFMNFSPVLAEKKMWVDMWGDTGKKYCVNIALYKGTTKGNATGYICLDDTTHNLYLIGSDGDTCFVNVTTSTSEFNMKPRIFLDFYSKSADLVYLAVKGTSGTMHVWDGYVQGQEGYYGNFVQNSVAGTTTGNSNLVVSDIACTKSVITVAAYTSKIQYTNILGAVTNYFPYTLSGRLTPFSSHGPTVDGRIKPDIAAPGMALASALNSYDTTLVTTGSNYATIVKTYTFAKNGRTYSYGMESGTSMATPCVTGIVALMLEANPTLTPDSVKSIINQTAIKDANTGSIPATGNAQWGHGKINAYAAVVKTIQQVSVSSVANNGMLDCNVYPNPNKGSFSISYKAALTDNITIGVYDVTGRKIMSRIWQVARGSNNTNIALPSGIMPGNYLLQLSGNHGNKTYKIVIE